MHQSLANKIMVIILCVSMSYGCAFAATVSEDATGFESDNPNAISSNATDNVAPMTPEEMNIQEGLANGQVFGQLDGSIEGRAHQLEGYDISYGNLILGDYAIIAKYNLAVEDYNYRVNFIKAYKSYYEIAYNSAYRSASLLKIATPVNNGRTYGLQAGKVEGKVAAMKDYYQNRYNNWERAYNEFLNSKTLNTRYALDAESIDYGLSFRTAFEEGFYLSYYETFQKEKLDVAIRNRTSELVTGNKTILKYDDVLVDFSGGSSSSKTEVPVMIDIPDAAIYTPTYLSLYKNENLHLENEVLESASSKFVVEVDNVNRSMDLNKPLRLIFTFKGSENAGIYKWENNKWFYQITEFKEDSIYTEIPKGTYTGGEYIVLIDPENSSYTDMRFNWAAKEINALKRRGYLEDELTFRPTNFITKLEMARMLYKVYANSEMDGLTFRYTIRDDDIDPNDFKYINYVLNNNYMMLDAEGKFNPNDTVQYQEVETIMSTVLMRPFSWNDVADKMLREKYKRSRGSESISRPIFRDEFAYIMYLYDDLK
ncbi:S-layer homology domain-containing protein [Fusibacter ferrireducens]|uniref:S-layer homology domain-containing protein n=1 Tax=Fusibacter ferrireducens TaxID=2785058 RepID=A0ABR9ZUL0_9FIRM|nr:S-layer homology domain-containing protein [Fusibacter ferrireducens]MBF4693843.1 S-layer homology domain-containing protein [Fusibacter ferrireducens]